MTHFNNLHVENFWSWGNCDLYLGSQGPTLVLGTYGSKQGEKDSTRASMGSNGAGKSSVFQAILWCLFGKTAKGVSGDQIVNEAKGKDCMVSLTGTSSVGTFTVTRYRKHHEHKNALHFKVNGADVTSSGVKATEKIVHKTLGINYETFVQTTFFDPSVVDGFCGLTDSSQKGVFDALLDLSDWQKAHEEAKSRLRRYKTSLEAVRGKLTIQIKSYEQSRATAIDFQNDTSHLEPKNVAAEVKSMLKELIAERQILSVQMKKYSEITSKITTIGTAIQTNNISIKTEAYTEVCPQCNQTKPSEKQKFMVAETRRLQDLKESLLTERGELNYDPAALATNARRIDGLRGQLHALEEAARHRKFKLRKQRAIVKENLKDVRKLRKAERQLEKAEEIFSEVVKATGPKGVRSYIVNTVLPVLNESLSKYSADISDGQLLVRVDFNNENNRLEVIVNKQGGGSYASCSGGEARRVDIAMLFGLLDMLEFLGKAPNFIVLDEIFDHLDRPGVDKVVEILLDRTDSCFVISHNENLKSHFSNVLHVEKANGESYFRL